MIRVVDDTIITCPFCGTVMKEIEYTSLFKRENGKELIRFTLGCPKTGCETEVCHTTFMEYNRSEYQSASDLSFEDQMALDTVATGGE